MSAERAREIAGDDEPEREKRESQAMSERSARRQRQTGETNISLELAIDGARDYDNSTGVGFFDHMLDLFARHGRFGLKVEATGDTETGAHHTVEDVGIVLGQAFDEALGDRAGIRRYGFAAVPMDEALAECAIDISGRPHVVFRADLPKTSIAGFESELAEEFFRAFANAAKLTLHVEVRYGSNVHHMIEAAFKAFARALRVAVSIDPEESGIPSTKGTLNE
jgi:imidazoleglycerol-phosphate dehydratase